jgi:hypothetical protein
MWEGVVMEGDGDGDWEGIVSRMLLERNSESHRIAEART